ncbi:MAG TPA: hypothetical protein VEX86_02355 [Longimicrobium sp.]|nr:hypothetical protein [Longimicrobium sp.]
MTLDPNDLTVDTFPTGGSSWLLPGGGGDCCTGCVSGCGDDPTAGGCASASGDAYCPVLGA